MKRYTYRKELPRTGIFRTWEYDYRHVDAESFNAMGDDIQCDLASRGFRLFTITKL